MGPARVRWGEVSDAEAVAGVHVRSWQEGYRGLLPQEMLDGLRPEDRLDRWRTWLSAAEPPRRGVLVAHDDERLVGFAAIFPSQQEDAARVGTIGSLYVDPPAWGRGVGRELLNAARAAFSQAGFREATLWVLDTNEPGRRFYEACGWQPDGLTQRDVVEGVEITDVRYRVALTTQMGG